MDPPLLSDDKEAQILHKPMAGDALLPGTPTLSRYLTHIRHPCAAASDTAASLRACLAAVPPQLTIDASPMYLGSPFTPLQLRSISSETKVLVMLREPLARLESLFYHHQQMQGRWEDLSFDALTDQFFKTVEAQPASGAALARLLTCGRSDSASGYGSSSSNTTTNTATNTTKITNTSSVAGDSAFDLDADAGAKVEVDVVRCQEEGWRDLAALGLMSSLGLRLFTHSLYVYALAPWRRHYFRPGRVMLVDSHTYFHDRLAVMEQVVRFLYGREMTSVERELAATAPPTNPHLTAALAAAAATAAAAAQQEGAGGDHDPMAAPPPAPWRLSGGRRARLGAFLAQHVTLQLYDTLEALRREGAWVVGFDRAPWPWAAGDVGSHGQEGQGQEGQGREGQGREAQAVQEQQDQGRKMQRTQRQRRLGQAGVGLRR